MKRLLFVLSYVVFILLSGCNNLAESENNEGSSTASQPPPTLPVDLPAATAFEITAVPGGFEPKGPAWEVVHIGQPGPLSEVTSPVRVWGISGPTHEQFLTVQISDQNGTVLTRQGTSIQAGLGQAGRYEVFLDFSVNQDQPGLISVYYTSARDGGVVHLTSIPVTLLASGESKFTEGADPGESIYIRTPRDGAAASGGILEVEGLVETALGDGLGIVLCGEFGEGTPETLCGAEDSILAEGAAEIGPQERETHSWFNGVLTYAVSGKTDARIAVFIISPITRQYIHVSTQYITLYP